MWPRFFCFCVLIFLFNVGLVDFPPKRNYEFSKLKGLFWETE